MDNCVGRLSFHLPFLYQYVDDLILAVPSGKQDELLQVFNSFNNFLQFTLEVEQDGVIAFLDTKLIRTSQDTIILDWYQKPTHAGRYVHYLSQHNIKMKTNVVLGLKNRITRLVHPSLLQQAIKRLYLILLDNGYPKLFLNKLLFSTCRREVSTASLNNTLQQPNTQIKYVSLPHIPQLTDKLVKALTIDNIKIARYNLVTNNVNFSNLKDKIPILKNSNVVYSIRCLGCDSQYIGQTSQSLISRISGHKSDIRLHPDRCALAFHSSTSKHLFDFDNTKVLHKESNTVKRLFLELCEIYQSNNSVNKKSDLQNLSRIYSYLLSVRK